MVAEYITLDDLATQLSEIKQQLFSGRVLLKSSLGQEWCLYFYLGRILYATGGSHPIRRWVRNTTTSGVDVGTSSDPKAQMSALTNISALTPAELNSCWEYYLLVNWAKQNRINRERLIEHIQTTIVEVLFDIIYATQVSCERIAQAQLNPQLTLIDIDRAFGMAQQLHQQWQQAGLGAISPNLALEIVAIEEFQQSVAPSIYEVLRWILDGNHSIRDIGVKIHKPAVKIGESFLSYLNSGKLRLVNPVDLSVPSDRAHLYSNAPVPLIVCIDDSPFVCDRLEHIFQGVGYQFISVLDSMKAIPVVIAKKPQLIFLDLVMPNANGYEICSRLRKVSAFRDTPIVILTGNDGVIDRVRAKVVGATDFLTKPVQADLVLEVAQKYLHTVATNN
jgi:two-component system, chemotaxis family, response regulator PixG